MAKKAKVLLVWTKSISTDVVRQDLLVELVGSGVLVNTSLPPSVEQFTINVPEKTLVHVELVASDGTNVSMPATLDFEIGDLTTPESPTGLSYEVLEVFDDEMPPTAEEPPVPFGLET